LGKTLDNQFALAQLPGPEIAIEKAILAYELKSSFLSTISRIVLATGKASELAQIPTGPPVAVLHSSFTTSDFDPASFGGLVIGTNLKGRSTGGSADF